MNKRAFTLVELLSVIVIVALISGIAAITYTSFVRKASDTAFTSYQNTMHAEAINYLYSNHNRIIYTDNKVKIYLADLSIDPFNNPKNKNDTCINDNSYVEATRSYSATGVLSMLYKVCLNCPDSGFNNCKNYDN